MTTKLTTVNAAKVHISVVSAVAKAFGVSEKDIRANSRGNETVSEARQVAMFVHNFRAHCFQRDTAKLFRRNPSTVTHAMQTVQKRMRKSRAFRGKVMKLANS